MYTNPHIALLQIQYRQSEILHNADRAAAVGPARRRRAGRYARRRKLTLPAKKPGALAGSIPARL